MPTCEAASTVKYRDAPKNQRKIEGVPRRNLSIQYRWWQVCILCKTMIAKDLSGLFPVKSSKGVSKTTATN
jgi:hypothetical protein